jgi:uncharacterized membrane protein YjgN (DUF898 family)
MNESILDAPFLAASETPAERVIYPLQFRGTGSEYFRIWVVNLLLSIVTLGVFSAWAKVRRLRYFYGNTLLDGHSFDYHARPIVLLRGRLIVFACYVLFVIGVQFYVPILFGLIPLLVLGMPWILLRSRRFQLRMTSWRNLRFDFRGTYGGAMNAFMGWYLLFGGTVASLVWIQPNGRIVFLVMLAVGLAYPYWVHKKVEYAIDHARYGQADFGFFTGIGRYYLMCIVTAVLSILSYFLFAFLFFLIPELREAVQDAARQGIQLEGLDLVIASGPVGWLLLLVAALVGFAIAGFYKAQYINASFGGARLGTNQLVAKLGMGSLMWINVTNLLGIVFTLGVYYPWARIRLLRYQLENIHVDSDGRVAHFEAVDTSSSGALGEEASDFFNVDLGI